MYGGKVRVYNLQENIFKILDISHLWTHSIKF